MANQQAEMACHPLRVVVMLAVALCGGGLLQAQVGDKASDTIAQQRKGEILRKADELLGGRYRPTTGEAVRRFDKDSEWGPSDAVLYSHGTGYVVELVFATDGSLVRVELFPEVLLHSDSSSDVPTGLELPTSQKEWLVNVANQLRPVGAPLLIQVPPDGCFQSSANLYCGDFYELASVSHYWREEAESPSLKQVTVGYKELVSGLVTDLRLLDDSWRELRVGSVWYRVDLEEPLLAKAAVGSFVRLNTIGCAGNEKVCDASLVAVSAVPE